MILCKNCQHENPNGILVCRNCNSLLIESVSLEETLKKQKDDFNNSTSIPNVRLDEFPVDGSLLIELDTQSLTIQMQDELIFGRDTYETADGNFVDLTPHGAYRKGVSRQHAVVRFIKNRYLELIDQGSSNGTFVNGKRLAPLTPYRLVDGDRIELGDLIMILRFLPSDES